MKRLWIVQKIANLFGYFFCPMCEKFTRHKSKYLIGGFHLCNVCTSEVISQNIKAWYKDYQS
jgi:hypothetical protein